MGKNKEEQARCEGMAYALRIAKQKGIEGLEEELEFRRITEFPCGFSRAACEEALLSAKMMVLDTVLLMSSFILHDTFGFGKKRLDKFEQEWIRQCEFLQGEYYTWEDTKAVMMEETGKTYQIRYNNKNVRDKN